VQQLPHPNYGVHGIRSVAANIWGLSFLSGVLTLTSFWVGIKLSAVLPFFLLSSVPLSILTALTQSWDFVRATTWWRYLAVLLVPVAFAAADEVILAISYIERVLDNIVTSYAIIATVALTTTAPSLSRVKQASTNPAQ
jgi:hypothetical protein